jgi:hypothetical protein
MKYGTVLLAVTLQAALVQPAAVLRNVTMHLTVLTSISDTEAAAGKKLAVAFDVTPKKAMHVYAPGKHDYQVITVKLDPQPWLKGAPTVYPPSEIYHFKELNEKVETYGKPFKLVQDISIVAAPPADARVSGRLEYQACDDSVCYAPTKVPFSFALTTK